MNAIKAGKATVRFRSNDSRADDYIVEYVVYTVFRNVKDLEAIVFLVNHLVLLYDLHAHILSCCSLSDSSHM